MIKKIRHYLFRQWSTAFKTAAITLLVMGAVLVAQKEDVDVHGAWRAHTYVLDDGITHTVDGLIFFTGRDWSVLFFVTDPHGEIKRGSGEGGTYRLSGDQLVLTHRYHLSTGEAMEGLPASDLRMVARGVDDAAPEEPCQVMRDGEKLTLYFPSGNSMLFERSS